MVKTSLSNAGGAGLIPHQGAKIPHAFWQKTNKQTENRNNIVTNLVKTLKMVHIKKAISKNRRVVFRFIAKLSRKYRVPIYLLSPHTDSHPQ